jgi:hypothetical protein
MRIDFYDPEMCCSTGVCGPSPDSELIRVEEMIEHLKAQGHIVTRYMPSRDSAAFTANQEVYEIVSIKGMRALPIVTVDGVISKMGRYPQIDELLTTEEH